MSFRHYIGLACLALALPASAGAATLDYSITADNAFALYISPSDSLAGTLIFSDLGGDPSQWSNVFTGTATVTGIEYIHIVGYNYTLSNGLWTTPGTPNGGGDNPDALIGSFTLNSGTFANKTNSLVTNDTDWSAIMVPPPSPDNPSTAPNPGWVTPIGPAQSYGPNGTGPWGTVAGLPANADWIWSIPDNGAYADFSAEVLAPTNALGTPLPGALPLFVTGLGGLGLFGWRRKRKATGVAA